MKALILSLIMIASPFCWADNPPQLGNQFNKVAQEMTTEQPEKIEVLEIFWYGCIHCYQMEAPLEVWVKKLPKDVYLRRLPGLPNPSWEPMAKAYYALEALDLLEKLHRPLFDAVHKARRLNPTDEKAIIDWITAKSGQDRAKIANTFSSFGTKTNLNRAVQLFKASGATGVPSLVINGKFITSGVMAGSNEEALKVADYLIDNQRKIQTKK